MPVVASHPSRGAWIEMLVMAYDAKGNGRTPHGVRGLKFALHVAADLDAGSHPSRGAWIEMVSVLGSNAVLVVAPLTGCVD